MIGIGRRHTGTLRRAAARHGSGLARFGRFAVLTGLSGVLALTGCSLLPPSPEAGEATTTQEPTLDSSSAAPVAAGATYAVRGRCPTATGGPGAARVSIEYTRTGAGVSTATAALVPSAA